MYATITGPDFVIPDVDNIIIMFLMVSELSTLVAIHIS